MKKLVCLLGISFLTASSLTILTNEKVKMSHNIKNEVKTELIAKKEDSIKDINNTEITLNGIIPVDNYLYGAMVGYHKISFYRVKNKINSDFELIKTFQFDIQLQYATAVKGIVVNGAIYYQNIVLKNNKTYIYIYKLDLDTLKMTEIGNQIINNNIYIFNGDKSNIDIQKYDNKIIFLYKNISINGGGIVILDLQTNQISSLESDLMVYFSIIYKNKIWFLTTDKTTYVSSIKNYDLVTKQLIAKQVDNATLPTSFFAINKNLYATVSPMFSDYSNIINLSEENNEIIIKQVAKINKRNLQIINSFDYKNNNYLIYKYIDPNQNVSLDYSQVLNFSFLKEVNIVKNQVSPQNWIDLSFTNNVINVFNDTFNNGINKIDLINYNIENNNESIYSNKADVKEKQFVEANFSNNNWILSDSIYNKETITKELYKIIF